MQLKQKTVYITGAASGIGKALAQSFAKKGANVVVADLNLSNAKTVAELLPKHDGQKHLALAVDVCDEKQVNESVDAVVNAYATLDIAIANAGIQVIEPVHQLQLSQWKKVLSVHLDGAFLLTKACLANIENTKTQKMIYMGSVHSKLASALKAPYVSAKHGLIGFCKTVAKEAAIHKMATHVICPGFVKTPLVEQQIPQQAKALNISETEVVEKIMLKDTVDAEFTTLDEICECAIFLASFEGLALTGQSFVVSHGWHMQ